MTHRRQPVSDINGNNPGMAKSGGDGAPVDGSIGPDLGTGDQMMAIGELGLRHPGAPLEGLRRTRREVAKQLTDQGANEARLLLPLTRNPREKQPQRHASSSYGVVNRQTFLDGWAGT